jgi:hypothetical protein
MKKILAIAIILMIVCLISREGFALGGRCGLGKTIEAAETTGVETIKGKVVCFGCTLKKEKGAEAQCSLYGHINAIRTKDGKIWTILENDKSTELIHNHDYVGSDIEIRGKKIAEAQVIEVDSFKILSEGEHTHKH